MVLSALMGYSMCVVQYPHSWLMGVQHSITTTLKQSMRIPANLDDEPFLMKTSKGGRGLTSLVDLQNATLCTCTVQEITSWALSALTIDATWNHAFTYNGSHVAQWVEAIKEMGWQAWPKVGDLDWVGHFTADPALEHALVGKGIIRWTHMMDNNKLKPAHLIVGVTGTGVTGNEYSRIQAVVESRMHTRSPVMLAGKTLREINKFSPLPDELHDLHYNHHTNTLTVFTDGSCVNDHAAGAIYFGPQSSRNWAFSVAAAPISMVVELHSIEEALLCVPAGINVCVATDSKASIEAISNWHAWKPGRRAKQEGRGTIERINALLSQFRASGRTVRFQHIYSHIDQKLRLAVAKGDADKLRAKLQVLKGELWGPFEAWVKGNEGADRLATIGHSRPHASEPWTVPALGLAVTLFDKRGYVVEGNIRRKVAAAGAKRWTDAMRRKPVRGAFLRDAHTDYKATHSALDSSRDPFPSTITNKQTRIYSFFFSRF